jgi:hypothetical protein
MPVRTASQKAKRPSRVRSRQEQFAPGRSLGVPPSTNGNMLENPRGISRIPSISLVTLVRLVCNAAVLPTAFGSQ